MQTSEQGVMIIAIGGATCSGKTTLAKHLQKILPNSVILHQDDMAPPADLIPIHPVHNMPDWDHPSGAIDWPRFRTTLQDMHQDPAHPLPASHDQLNVQPDVPVDEERFSQWHERFKAFDNIRFVIVEGFLLYYDKECVKEYDVRLFVRESPKLLEARRRARGTYNTAEGQAWRDPPKYWSLIVWPSYILGHQHMFRGHNVESELDESNWAGEGVILLQASRPSAPTAGSEEDDNITVMSMSDMLERSLEAIHLRALKFSC